MHGKQKKKRVMMRLAVQKRELGASNLGELQSQAL